MPPTMHVFLQKIRSFTSHGENASDLFTERRGDGKVPQQVKENQEQSQATISCIG
jgi:hypothetical protein